MEGQGWPLNPGRWTLRWVRSSASCLVCGPIGVLRGQGSGAGSLPTAPQALEDTAPHLHPHSLLCATCSDFASPTLTERWLFLSELQISQLLNLCLPRGAQRQSPILVQSYISLGCPPTWPLSQAHSLGIQSCPLLILLPPLGWVFRLLLGLLMITMI